MRINHVFFAESSVGGRDEFGSNLVTADMALAPLLDDATAEEV